MAELINCIECGGQISSQAGECPYCKTEYPKGTKCIFCNQVMKQSEAWPIGSISIHSGGYPIWAHHCCYNKTHRF